MREDDIQVCVIANHSSEQPDRKRCGSTGPHQLLGLIVGKQYKRTREIRVQGKARCVRRSARSKNLLISALTSKPTPAWQRAQRIAGNLTKDRSESAAQDTLPLRPWPSEWSPGIQPELEIGIGQRQIDCLHSVNFDDWILSFRQERDSLGQPENVFSQRASISRYPLSTRTTTIPSETDL